MRPNPNSCMRRSAGRRSLHSFPTRRSSDLQLREGAEIYSGHVDRDRQVPSAMIVSVARVQIELPVIEALGDRKSTRLNSSHITISYAVFCLKKKKLLI